MTARTGTSAPWVVRMITPTVRGVTQFFRVVQQGDGSWWYRRGRQELKSFSQFSDALAHARDVASEHPPSEVRVHRLNGRVEVVATFG